MTDHIIGHLTESYSGPALIIRLSSLVGSDPENTGVRQYFINYLKSNTLNTSLLQKIDIPPNPENCQWREDADTKFAQRLSQAERNLQECKASQNGSKIQSAIVSIARLHSHVGGNHNAAMTRLSSLRELVIDPAEKVSLMLAIVTENVHAGQLHKVQPEIMRFVASNEADHYPTQVAVLKAILALSHINQLHFQEAAKILLSIDQLPDYPELFTVADLTRLTVLSAMASFDRARLRKDLMNNPKFIEMPDICRLSCDALSEFCSLKFSQALEHVGQMISNYLFADPYLTENVRIAAIDSIRRSAMLSYVSPYESICMNKMAKVFNLTVPQTERDLVYLIRQGLLPAKVDTQHCILWANKSKQRENTFLLCEKVMSRFIATSSAMSLRVAQLQYDVIVGGKKSNSDERLTGQFNIQ
uniref:PCI domain-containing protein n=1 Tax=Spongospora subterranea TaxID=70186 RepID=A0A0H5RN20_9EUKA|eukprot:CRZ10139.1 hypothetical protein [Spongospora subterranea]